MPIPDYQSLMPPLLRLASDKKEHKVKDSVESLAKELCVSEDEKTELLPSGSQAVFNNRVGCARSYLKQAGLLSTPKRGYFIISDQGLKKLERLKIQVGFILASIMT